MIRRSINPDNVPASTVPSTVLRSRGSVSWAAASSNPPEPPVDKLLSSLWLDSVDVDPIRLCPSMLPDLDDGVTIIGCISRDKSVFEDVDGSGKSMGGFNDQSEGSFGGDTLVGNSAVVDGSGVRKLELNGDGFCGYGMDFPGAERGPDVTPDGGEELRGMFRIGDLRIGKEAGSPLCVSPNSGSSRTTGIGTGALGGVKPVKPYGLDKLRPD